MYVLRTALARGICRTYGLHQCICETKTTVAAVGYRFYLFTIRCKKPTNQLHASRLRPDEVCTSKCEMAQCVWGNFEIVVYVVQRMNWLEGKMVEIKTFLFAFLFGQFISTFIFELIFGFGLKFHSH